MDYVIHQPTGAAATRPPLPGQVVLVFQGGGALGAYQGGVYQAMHEAGIEPDWVVGTSIGAINGAIIAGNEVGQAARSPAGIVDADRAQAALGHQGAGRHGRPFRRLSG